MKRIRSSAEQRAERLSRCPLFSDLPARDLRSLASFTSQRSYETEEVLFQEGVPAEGFHVVVEGPVKVCRFNVDGREQIMHVFGPGQPCGEVPMFQGQNYPAAALAFGPLTTIYVPRERFVALCRERPAILLSMLAVLSVRLRHFVQLVDDLSLKEVSARLAKYILDLSVRSGGAQAVKLDSSKRILASRLGTIAETLSRTLAKMQRRGYIHINRREITIRDDKALQALAAGLKL